MPRTKRPRRGLCARPDQEAAQAIVSAQLTRSKLPDAIAGPLLYRLAQSGDAKATKQLLDRLRSVGHHELATAVAS